MGRRWRETQASPLHFLAIWPDGRLTPDLPTPPLAQMMRWFVADRGGRPICWTFRGIGPPATYRDPEEGESRRRRRRRMKPRINAAVAGAVAGLAGVANAAAQTRLQDRFFGGGDGGFVDVASAGNGGVATASANGGAVSIGDINSGGNTGCAIGIGDTF